MRNSSPQINTHGVSVHKLENFFYKSNFSVLFTLTYIDDCGSSGKILSSGFLKFWCGSCWPSGPNDCTENVSGERHNLLVMGEQHSSILLRESFLWENKQDVNQGRFFKKIYSHDLIQETSRFKESSNLQFDSEESYSQFCSVNF